MADTDLVKMKLTFWRDGLKPGDIVEVPADEVHRWDGYAKPVGKPTPKTDPEERPHTKATAPADKAK